MILEDTNSLKRGGGRANKSERGGLENSSDVGGAWSHTALLNREPCGPDTLNVAKQSADCPVQAKNPGMCNNMLSLLSSFALSWKLMRNSDGSSDKGGYKSNVDSLK